MFEPGIKVMVVASSTTKSMGARHGSIGYITDCGYPEYVGDVYVGKATATVAPAGILFTRYGFGKERERYEKKSVLTVFPIFPRIKREESVNDEVDRFVKKFKREKFNESGWYNAKSMFYDKPESIDTCIVAPYPARGTDLLNCSDTEFNAWFDSIILLHKMRVILDKIHKSKYASRFPASANTHFMHLRDCARHRDVREEFLRMLGRSSKLKKSVIETIRMIYCAGEARPRITDRKAITVSYQSGFYHNMSTKDKRIKPSTFYRMFVEKIFNEQAFAYLDASRRNYSIKGGNLVSKSITETRDALQNMASVLSCK